jgi:hypothetical protein
MKHRPMVIVVASLLGGLSHLSVAQQASGHTTQTTMETSPGKGTITKTHKIVATVESIDAAKRHVTLKGPKGNLLPLTVGPDVRNLEQVKVGDRVVVRYAEALSLTLMKDGKELRSSTEASTGARAKAGERPGGVVAEEVKVTADVIGVNRKTHMVTLRGPNEVVDLHVVDPQQLKLIKVGDQVDAVYAQALALSVEPVAASKK